MLTETLIVFTCLVLTAVSMGAVFHDPPRRGAVAAAERTARREDTTAEMLHSLVRQFPHVTYWKRRRIYLRLWAAAASNQNCDKELLTELAQHTAASPRDSRFLRKRSEPDVVSFVMVREQVAANPNCDPETLQMLASDPRSFVRAAAASNPSAPEATVDHLAGDPFARVRWTVAKRDDCSHTAAMMLASDKHHYVRRVMADSVDCPPEALQRLADHRSVATRVRVAKNSTCTPELAARLAADRSADVRAVAVASPAISSLWPLAGDASTRVRAAIAARGDCPNDLQVHLAGDRRAKVRAAVASNSSTPSPLLETLVCDHRGRVAWQAGANPALGRGGIPAILECASNHP